MWCVEGTNRTRAPLPCLWLRNMHTCTFHKGAGEGPLSLYGMMCVCVCVATKGGKAGGLLTYPIRSCLMQSQSNPTAPHLPAGRRRRGRQHERGGQEEEEEQGGEPRGWGQPPIDPAGEHGAGAGAGADWAAFPGACFCGRGPGGCLGCLCGMVG